MSQLYPSPPSLAGSWWERKKAAEEVRARIEYDRLCRRYDRESVDELIAAITDVLCSTRPMLRIGGELLPTQQVRLSPSTTFIKPKSSTIWTPDSTRFP